jgi:hypothetical protein
MLWAVQYGVQYPVGTKYPNTVAQPAHYSKGIGILSLGNKPDRK